MKISYNWLRAISAFEADAPTVAERLTHGGLEVESSTEVGAGLDGVVVAEVRASRPHPKRDKLKLVRVFDGASEVELVCGAPNVPEPGALVAWARPGSNLPGGAVESREVGGIRSDGMLASESELGVGAHAAGILVLDPGLSAGLPLAKALKLHDFILDVAVTPNRADCLGHRGMARDLCALLSVPFDPPEADAPPRAARGSVGDLVDVVVEDAIGCPRYAAAAVSGLSIRPSPFWLRYRLYTLGIRPISNVVDVTNLILLEYGQPLHAFDLDRVRGAKIVVRRARPNETMRTLDGIERRFVPEDLLICDGGGPVAVAGVMGGEESGIAAETTRVLIECAMFDPRSIRRTAKRLGLSTESSMRFERGVDPRAIPEALVQAANLMVHLGGGAAVPDVVDRRSSEFTPLKVPLRLSRVERLLGDPVPVEGAKKILVALGCTIEPAHGGDKLEVHCPTHRPDLTREVDLIEEIARVRGYDRIPTRPSRVRVDRFKEPAAGGFAFRRRLKERLRALGFDEAVSYAFVSPRDVAACRLPPAEVALKNPLSEERSVLRPSLLPGLLTALGRAQRASVERVRSCELGTTFHRASAATAPLPEERRELAALVWGPRDEWLRKPEPMDFYDAKGVAAELVESLAGLGIELVHAPDAAGWLHPRSAARLSAGARTLGLVGEVHPDVIEAFELTGLVGVFVLSVDALGELCARQPAAAALPRFPAVERDFAVLVDERVRAAEIVGRIRDAAGAFVRSPEAIRIFDLYRGSQIPAGKKSVAVRVTYRAADRTLTDAEVDAAQKAAVVRLREDLGAEIR